MFFVAAVDSPDLWSWAVSANDYSSAVIPVLVLWILDLRKRNQALEKQILEINQQVQEKVIPMVTRLLDLVPSILARLKGE